MTKGHKPNPTPRQASRPADASGCGEGVRRGLEGWLGSPVRFGGGRPARSDAAIKQRDPRRGGGGVPFSTGRPPLRKQRLRSGTGATPQPRGLPEGAVPARPQRPTAAARSHPRAGQGRTGPARPAVSPWRRASPAPFRPRSNGASASASREGRSPAGGVDVDGTHNAWREAAAVAGRRCRRRRSRRRSGEPGSSWSPSPAVSLLGDAGCPPPGACRRQGRAGPGRWRKVLPQGPASARSPRAGVSVAASLPPSAPGPGRGTGRGGQPGHLRAPAVGAGSVP